MLSLAQGVGNSSWDVHFCHQTYGAWEEKTLKIYPNTQRFCHRIKDENETATSKHVLPVQTGQETLIHRTDKRLLLLLCHPQRYPVQDALPDVLNMEAWMVDGKKGRSGWFSSNTKKIVSRNLANLRSSTCPQHLATCVPEVKRSKTGMRRRLGLRALCGAQATPSPGSPAQLPQTSRNHLTRCPCCSAIPIPSNPAPSGERNYCIFPKYWGGGPKSVPFLCSTVFFPIFYFLNLISCIEFLIVWIWVIFYFS